MERVTLFTYSVKSKELNLTAKLLHSPPTGETTPIELKQEIKKIEIISVADKNRNNQTQISSTVVMGTVNAG